MTASMENVRTLLTISLLLSTNWYFGATECPKLSVDSFSFGLLPSTSGRNQKKCFQGGKGAGAPQLWSTINFDRPAKGAGFLVPPNFWSLEGLSPIRNIVRCFVAFCGVLWRFAAFCGVLRRFGAFF